MLVAGEDGVDLRVRLEHVLEHGEALVALPVRGLGGHDLDGGCGLDRLAEPAQPRVTGLVARDALQHRDFRPASARVHEMTAREPAPREFRRTGLG